MNEWAPVVVSVAGQLIILVGLIVSFRVHLEKRLGECVTRTELNGKIDKLQLTIDTNEERGGKTRHSTDEGVGLLATKIAVMDERTKNLTNIITIALGQKLPPA